MVAFASDKRLDPSFLVLNEKPWFFGNRPLGMKANPSLPPEDDMRARWWPGDEPEEDSDGSRR